ncbi:Cytoplasmic dynein 1 heavy chain 1 [Cichlidogyrus casuarinus]|uniref:Dynein heavy chain, cytoplasmic n=1 Tax=Cichlidogyrus casuarinus TaxID=1844966 RepID=A0ABD2QP32_9PLAT
MFPFFKSYVKESGKADRDGDKMVVNIEKKMSELEVGLLHLQQNIDIPDISLTFHPTVLQIIKKKVDEGSKATIQDFDSLMNDDQFLRSLQMNVKTWIKEIQKVTKLDRDPGSGTALQEITFWLNLERSLLKIQEKLQSVEVSLTMDILKSRKIFRDVISFDADTGLSSALEKVNDYNPLMKDFPINDLLSASELGKIKTAIAAIFFHLKKLRNTKYPMNRALELISAISRDLSNQLLKVLSAKRLMYMSYEEFDQVMRQCNEVFATWDDEYERQSSLMRDLVKKKRDDNVNRLIWRIKWSHKNLQTRIDQMKKFRHQHEQLRQVIVRVLAPVAKPEVKELPEGESADEASGEKSKALQPLLSEGNAIEEVDQAYEIVREIDCLDVSREGQDSWDASVKRYEERIDRVETQITARLRDLLGTARNANEMFRHFSRFNALFIRPHIRGAIREYQAKLIQRVKDDINRLHDIFKEGYINSNAHKSAKMNDIPEVAGSVIWVQNIELHLNKMLKRVEDVLGKGWENHRDGQQLKQEGDSFKAHLNPNNIFDNWCRRMQDKSVDLTGRVFTIDSSRSRFVNPDGNTETIVNLHLRINLDMDDIQLFKEVRLFKSRGFRVPISLMNRAHQTSQIYPSAITLDRAIKMYENCNHIINEHKQQNIGLLCAGLRREIQQIITEGISLTWDSYRLRVYLQRLTDKINQFEEKVEELLHATCEIELQLKNLETCPYSKPTFEETLKKIQQSVDNLCLYNYSNLTQWVAQLDKNIEARLIQRLDNAIGEWTNELTGNKRDFALEPAQQPEQETDDANFLSHRPVLKLQEHELRLSNQQISLFPNIYNSRQELLLQLASWENTVLLLPRIQHSRYQIGLEQATEDSKTYGGLLPLLPNGSQVLTEAIRAIDNVVTEAEDYVSVWRGYQNLWELQTEHVYNQLGKDVDVWMSVLDEIKAMRKHFDVSDTHKDFGPIKIRFANVQSQVSIKYDTWHSEILSKFGSNLGSEISELNTHISNARRELEQKSIDVGSTQDAVNLIIYCQSLKRKMNTWEKQDILYRDRYQFPSNWLYSENLQGEWSAFQEILKRREASINSQMSSLQMKIVSEDKLVENRTNDLLQEWDKEKPVHGNSSPSDAVNILTILEGKFNRLSEERENMQRAKEALFLAEPGQVPPSEEKVTVAIEELQDLKTVWSELSGTWQKIEQLRETPWPMVQPRKIRQSIDEMVGTLKEMPSKFRYYAAYEHVKKTLQSFGKVNAMLAELKSEALKDRHWKQLMRKLNVQWVLSDLTLGQMYDIDLQKNEPLIREVLLVAQGEKALEEFLKQVTDVWKNYQLELVVYQNKCRLIKGWDDLFAKVKEHISSVTAMKFSPYFKQFEEEALSWEDRLNRINALFDVWIDVQRRWVYQDGIFASSADIKALLPQESQRFQSVSTEFLGLMKKVAKSPNVLDVVNISNVQRQLDRLADLLNLIQRSLGEYLEKQRSSFPRFYFVGDEDLLEIIGNSKNLPRLQKHFKKMFSGIDSIELNEAQTIITGFRSKEDEFVTLVQPISLEDNPVINDWLALLEKQMRLSLATYLSQSVVDLQRMKLVKDLETTGFLKWVDAYQAQLLVLAAQIVWTETVENAFNQMAGKPSEPGSSPLSSALASVESMLNVLADSVLYEQPAVRRQKLETLIMEHVHQRDVIRQLMLSGVQSAKDFEWLSQMRFSFDPKQSDPLQKVTIEMANAKFFYGFEYLGVTERLVQTPLTDRCYLTLTQALEARLGGSPFGPAGTGKTESVKALGTQLGRFCLVFNCDETFDFHAMGRIFVGLCQVGAWGCFDEFNRLEERMLSAVSQQVQSIQESLRKMANLGAEKAASQQIKVELLGRQVTLNPDMAIFITMNPGYAGRSNLPDNLKKLFRSIAMTQPDRQLIAQVKLYSQGFRTAELLAGKVVPFFKLCDEQLSPQSHYDFGLRALKSVLTSAGNVKRDRIKFIKDDLVARNETINESAIAEGLPEQEILIQSVMETLVPKLVAEDIPLLYSLLTDVFPGTEYNQAPMQELRRHLKAVSQEMYYVYDEAGSMWVEKVLQLYQICNIHHGLMMVGPSGSGKSSAWRVLLKALERLEGIEGVAHVIDPKSISKDSLYGYLDPNTREWTDGLFTHVLRKIIDNIRGEASKRQWIIFDGDVDPEWVENLNSVLDDNKLLTLPNGERLGIPPNVRIMFEVQNLKYATLATVSRCGMVWFSEDVLSTDMILNNYITSLQNVPLDEGEDESLIPGAAASPGLQLQRDVANILQPYFQEDGIVQRCLEFAKDLEHVMDFTRLRALTSMFSIMRQVLRNIMQYNQNHPDFSLPYDQMEGYVSKSLICAIIWSMSGDGKLKIREEMSDYIRGITSVGLPPAGHCIIDFEVTITGDWQSWSAKVPQIEVDTHKIETMDVVIPTLDTVRHESLLYTWLAEHRPMLLCGPPGSGKTMTLFSALRNLPNMEVIGLNFSSATTPELMLKTFDQYCEYRKTPHGLVLAPQQMNKWLVFFCDEINLPDLDKYGTQRVISFLRQIVENHGFYQTRGEMQWVKLERIQFVGACNPPTDPGRKPLSHRFLRHVPLVYVDYPGETSLKQIYGTFTRAMLRPIVSLRSQADALTCAMVDFFLASQQRFTVDMQPHYIYSPREMTRWIRGIYEALKPLDTLSIEGLVRIWAHEALRLFQDRLVEESERQWTDENIDQTAMKYFPGIDSLAALQRPILFSNWLSKDYSPVEQEELRQYVKARLKVFYEEELDVPLVLFNQVLDNVLRIDRVFRQSQGHLLLIGVSGAGKTTLSRFVSWINGLTVFQVKVHSGYTAENFDDDLRNVLRRSGCKGEKIAFIMDESNVMDSSFLERMNTLLANGEVPGLFEGDEFTTLMTQCKEGAVKDGFRGDSHEELYKWFTHQICRNLHDTASTSPALFNRCVLNWFGDWSLKAYYQVGWEFTNKLDLERHDFKIPNFIPTVAEGLLPEEPTHRDLVVNAFVYVHQTLHKANELVAKRGGRTMAITPRHFLDFINHYLKLIGEKRSDLEEQQLHLNIGLKKINETVEQVEVMQNSLTTKRKELEEKNEAANSKLQQMLREQQEVDKEKTVSQQLQTELAQQDEFIATKRAQVMEELSEVEPAVKEAKDAVSSINKRDLQEVRAMRNPHATIRMALESICLLLGETSTDWKTILGFIMKESFVSSIINFDTDSISDEIRDKLKKQYLSNPDYNFEKVNRASSACGPMVKWALAQISYADILKKVDPLRNELRELEQAASVNKKKATEVEAKIAQLQISSAKFKEEYAVLVSEVQAIKADLSSVEAKVDRSVALIKSLSSERGRWESTSTTFQSQMTTIIGDCLLSSAFMAYAGYYDQNVRSSLLAAWSEHLTQADICYRQDLARVEFLSTPEERLRWKSNSLPDDELCVENAIMTKRFNRYPLIIDPSGQATEFILKEFQDLKITKTSFLDSAFRKSLEAALRFGTPLLVQDVEAYDAILNPVLNREVRKTCGRTLITLGDQDIDLSPTFTIFLSTRDPSIEFPPHICSRVTFVNFTVTRSSLRTQCLNAVLKAERPDVDKKRSDLIKIQGEFQLKLRSLEKDLLRALNESKGNLLDDNAIIARLETLKKEAAEVTTKVQETDKIIQEVEGVSKQYDPLAMSCASVYFTLEALNQVHYLYQYSLHYLLDIYNNVLVENPNLKGVQDPKQRLNIITRDMFQMVYDRTARGMLHNDQMTLAVLLARLYLRGGDGALAFENEFNYLLQDSAPSKTAPETQGLESIMPLEQAASACNLAKHLPALFAKLPERLKADSQSVKTWLQSVTPENEVPLIWQTPAALESGTLANIAKALYSLLVVQSLRPDRLLAACHVLVSTVFGESFMDAPRAHLDLGQIVESEIRAHMPVLLCAVQGFDPSGRVEDLAADKKKQLTSIAIGSAEGFTQASTAITNAAKAGRWVMLKNVHLAPNWLVQLEKNLHNLPSINPQFRLFLTMEITPKIPVNLIRAGRVLVFEPPPGIKASLLRTLASVPASRMCRAPSERGRLYFLLAWFNAVVQERLRYVPLGWSKRYEFNESDLKCACDTLDVWVDLYAMGRSNLPPEKVPWAALRTLMAQSIYGGKIDNAFDQCLMDSFLGNLFTEASYEHEFPLVRDIDGIAGKHICVPEGNSREDFIAWTHKLPEAQTPSWKRRTNTALFVGRNMLGDLLKMQQAVGEDDSHISVTKDKNEARKKSTADGRPAWMLQLHSTALQWLNTLPKILRPMTRTAENIKDPMYRCFERELNTGVQLLSIVRKDLEEVVQVCTGARKPTNHHRGLMNELVKGIIPADWKTYVVPSGLTVIEWVGDFLLRVKQLTELGEAAQQGGAVALRDHKIWLGGLFMPEAYVTASRQAVAQANSWALEELYLESELILPDKSKKLEAPPDKCSFLIKNLRLMGAEPVDKAKLRVCDAISTDMPLTLLRWIRVPKADQAALYQELENDVRLPVYLNASRAVVLFTLKFNTAEKGSELYKRGVAIISSLLS